MSFDYECLNAEGLAALPVKCTCDDKAVCELMKDNLLHQLWEGKVTKLNLGKMKWKLEPIGDHEQLRKDAAEKIAASTQPEAPHAD